MKTNYNERENSLYIVKIILSCHPITLSIFIIIILKNILIVIIIDWHKN